MKSDNDLAFDSITRRVLFGKEKDTIPGKGRSATESPRRHVRCKVTMNLDGDLIDYFKQQAAEQGRSYQLLINEALRQYLEGTNSERLAKIVGQILIEDSSFALRVAEQVAMLKSKET